MPEVLYTCADRLKQRITVEDGLTLADMALRLNPEHGRFTTPTVAFQGGAPVLRKDGGWQKPVTGSVIIIFVELPMGGGGGGSNPIMAIFAVVAIAIMWWNPGGWIAGSSMLGLSGAAASVAAGVVNGMIIAGMGMLAGAIAGTPKMSQGQSGAMNAAAASPTYNINASGNQARLYQPEPEGFGRMLIVPDYVAQTWTQYINNEQYGYFVYSLGRGRYSVESMQFGDTVFWREGQPAAGSGYDVDVEIVEPGDAVTLFPDNVITSEEVAGQEFFGPNEEEYKGAIGPYGANPPGTKTNRLLLDIVLPQGLGKYNDRGELQDHSVSWQFDYREIDDWGKPVSEWAVLTAGSLTLHTLTPQRLTLVCNVADARFEVQGRRTSNSPGDGRTMDTVQWTAMRAMLPGTLTYPQSVVALRIRAGNTLSQNASNRFKVLLTRKLPLYDIETGTWGEETPTRSWAAAVCSVCKAEWGGQIGDGQIDLETLWEIDARLQARGWFYDAYLDGAYNVWQLLTEMCQAQICIPRMSGAIFSAVEDRPGRPARYTLSPRNIRRGTFKVTWNTWSEQTPDDVTVNYLDSAYGYQQRDVTATLPESESREPSSLDIMGIVDRAHAFEVAVGYSARNRWRRINVECEVEGLGRRLVQGDVCAVAHPRFRDTAAGTLAAWDEAGLMLRLRLETGAFPRKDEDVYLALTAPDGSLWGPVRLLSLAADGEARMDPDDYAMLLLQGQPHPWRWINNGIRSIPTVWTLQDARNFSRRMIVQSVVPIDLWRSNVTLVNDDDRVGSYRLPVPPWQGRGQLPVVDSLETPQALVVRVGGLSGAPSLSVAWLTVVGADGYEVETSSDGARWERFGRVTVNAVSVSVAPGRVWVRVAAVAGVLHSGWAVWDGDSSITSPEAPEGLNARYKGGDLSLEWKALPGAASYTVQIVAAGSIVRSQTEVAGTAFVYTMAMAREDGGPWRELAARVFGVNAAGPGKMSEVTARNDVPALITDAAVVVNGDSVVLNGVTGGEDADATGYVMLRGLTEQFSAGQIAEMRTASTLPYVWSGIAPGTAYFRIAAKDAFYDVAGDYGALRYSAVLAVTVSAAESGGEGGNG